MQFVEQSGKKKIWHRYKFQLRGVMYAVSVKTTGNPLDEPLKRGFTGRPYR